MGDYPSDPSLAFKFWTFVGAIVFGGIVFVGCVERLPEVITGAPLSQGLERIIDQQLFVISFFLAIGCIGSFIAMVIEDKKYSENDKNDKKEG